MLNHQPTSVIAFHSCDIEVGLKVLLGLDNLKHSTNDWDWLGDGIYFWEQNPERALTYARECAEGRQKNKRKINTPFVLGCVIDLKNCFNLTESVSISWLKQGYKDFVDLCKATGTPIPQNKDANRKLDCAVIRYIHTVNEQQNLTRYDTVRAAFPEGELVYEGCEIREHTHIQISVRTEDCIKGYFLPKPFDAYNPYLKAHIMDKYPELGC
ncbi:hypothetical protein GWC95_00695 [Sediminibacterium roseum]|uniref:DUF3990 domain-containing protein n=1 Tax=Sediminibacterium roseum TaxID=1978412 RepID=A0ABW9ZQU6_9BACT|nr:hypothetical protein [Sediminibacterium roseum]NCI48418.1 hypothetical protein [Sediminibacterium roseum]